MVLLTVGISMSLIIVEVLWNFFLLLSCHDLIWYDSFCFSLLFFIFCHIWLLPFGNLFYLMRDRKGVNVEGRGCGDDLRGEEGGEATIKILCIRKQYFRQKGKTEILQLYSITFVHHFATTFYSLQKNFPNVFQNVIGFSINK